jgi:hypothetical protein
MLNAIAHWCANNWQGMIASSVAGYAARTIPRIKNPWGRWVIGVIQFVLNNADKGNEQIQNREDESADSASGTH